MANKNLTSFKKWFNSFEWPEMQIVLFIILGIIVLLSAHFVIDYHLDKKTEREKMAVGNVIEVKK